MITKEIKKAILDILKGGVDRGNYGMCSTYHVNPNSCIICDRNNIRVTGKQIIQNGVIIATIKRRYAARKCKGMYKELTSTITYID